MNKQQFEAEMRPLGEAIEAAEKTVAQLKKIRDEKLKEQYPAYALDPETGSVTPVIQTVPDHSETLKT